MNSQELSLHMVESRDRTDRMTGFELSMRQHQRLVLSVAYRLLGSMEDAKDAAQEVFFRFYKNWDRVDHERDVRPWLYRVTVNVCRDMRGVRTSELNDVPFEAGLDEQLDADARRQILHQGLAKLSPKEREAVVLRDVEGLSTTEVAQALGSTEATVRSQIRTARNKLRDFCLRRRR